MIYLTLTPGWMVRAGISSRDPARADGGRKPDAYIIFVVADAVKKQAGVRVRAGAVCIIKKIAFNR